MIQNKKLCSVMFKSFLQLVGIILILSVITITLQSLVSQSGYIYDTLKFIYDYTLGPLIHFVDKYLVYVSISWLLYMAWWTLTFLQVKEDDLKSFLVLRNISILPISFGLLLSFFFSILPMFYCFFLVFFIGILHDQIKNAKTLQAVELNKNS
jgi:hypothetical protein